MAKKRDKSPQVFLFLGNELKVGGNGGALRLIAEHLARVLRYRNPEQRFAWGGRIDYIYGYSMKKNMITLPRGYWPRLRRFLADNDIGYRIIDERVFRPYNRKRRTAPDITLRPYQIKAARRALTLGEGVIQAPCGSGKTQILTEIVRLTGQWTLILVHTDDLIQQMRERMEEAFGQPIGIIRQNEKVLRPITVASVMTLVRRKLSPHFLGLWGCVMLDESHHMPATSFTHVMRQFPAYYRFGTTATAQREDGLHGLMFATIGYRIFNVEYDELYRDGFLLPPYVTVVNTGYNDQFNPRTQYARSVAGVCADEDRNRLIVDRLIVNRNHRNLVLSSRIAHLQTLQEMLLGYLPDATTELMTAKTMPRKKRRETLEKMRNGELHFIFATQLADEGLDLPILDRVHLVFPTKSKRKIQQQVGRIQRKYPGKKTPVVYDYRDVFHRTFRKQFGARIQVYRDIGCEVSDRELVE